MVLCLKPDCSSKVNNLPFVSQTWNCDWMSFGFYRRIERDDYAVQDALCDKLADIVDMIIPESVVKETGKSKYMDQVIRLQSKVLGHTPLVIGAVYLAILKYYYESLTSMS